MAGHSVIQHKGIVCETEGDDVKVVITSTSACAACHAKGACGMGGSQEKIIEFRNVEKNFLRGEEVMVCLEQSAGIRAVLLGYFVPFLVLFLSLILFINLTDKEGLSALLAISLLAPYYGVLYMLRDRLQKTFHFKIRKIN